jgi:hypothetical protein
VADNTSRKEDNRLSDLVRKEIDISINAQSILEWVEENVAPERVYSNDVLGQWAIENGYVPEEVPA